MDFKRIYEDNDVPFGGPGNEGNSRMGVLGGRPSFHTPHPKKKNTHQFTLRKPRQTPP